MTYDLQPEMSAEQVTKDLISGINSLKYDVIICNFANADMVGHTGNLSATIRAVETLDQCIGKILIALEACEGELLITADHGNAESMLNLKTKQPHTAHTSNPVPVIYAGKRKVLSIRENGSLQDIAPTVLSILKVSTPAEMTGKSLFDFGL